MLKIIKLSNKLVFDRNNSNRPSFKKNNSNNKIDKFSIGDNSIKYTKKSEKLKCKNFLNPKIWLSQEKNS